MEGQEVAEIIIVLVTVVPPHLPLPVQEEGGMEEMPPSSRPRFQMEVDGHVVDPIEEDPPRLAGDPGHHRPLFHRPWALRSDRCQNYRRQIAIHEKVDVLQL